MPDPFKALVGLAKHGWSVETGTPAGNLNWRGLLFFGFLVILASLGGFVDLAATAIGVEYDSGPDPTQITYVWVGGFVLCLAFVTWEDHFSQKYLGTPPGGQPTRQLPPLAEEEDPDGTAASSEDD